MTVYSLFFLPVQTKLKERSAAMIPLTKLNGDIYFLNEALIERIEGTPDTVIILTDGKSYRAQEDLLTVVEMIRDYQSSLR